MDFVVEQFRDNMDELLLRQVLKLSNENFDKEWLISAQTSFEIVLAYFWGEASLR